MPTAQGGETIAERLTRLRAELIRVRAALARGETNGTANNIGGAAAITEIAFERLERREGRLQEQITVLEARLAGSRVRSGFAVFKTIIEDDPIPPPLN